jgi:hypothetical protein
VVAGTSAYSGFFAFRPTPCNRRRRT